jgi:hypothetical protein
MMMLMLEYAFIVISLLSSVVTCQLQAQYPLGDVLQLERDEYMTRAEKLMKQTPMIDGHNVSIS